MDGRMREEQGMHGADGEVVRHAELTHAPRSDRAIMLAVLLSVLILSRVLVPDASGSGTHTRMLMPPCIFKAATGVPCPLCGMTTAFARAARGDLLGAFHANPLGPPAFAGAVAVAVLLACSLLPGMTAPRQMVDALRGIEFARWVLLFIMLGWPIHIYLYLIGCE